GVAALAVVAAGSSSGTVVRGPSGMAAVSATYAAGTNPAREHEDPVPALPDAGIADLDTVAHQVEYAREAARLPQALRGQAWGHVGPFGQDDPATYPSGGLRFARDAGMGASAVVDPR